MDIPRPPPLADIYLPAYCHFNCLYEAVTFYEAVCIYLLPDTAAKSTPAIFIFLGPHQIEAITLFCPTLQCNLCLTSITLDI